MLGQIIKTYIVERGLIQTRVAQTIGMPPGTFSEILNGKRKIQAEEYFKICSALGVGLDYFVNIKKELEENKNKGETA